MRQPLDIPNGQFRIVGVKAERLIECQNIIESEERTSVRGVRDTVRSWGWFYAA